MTDFAGLDLSFLLESDWGRGATLEDYLLLTGIVAHLKPSKILEIGTDRGLGTIILAHAARLFNEDARLISVDIDQRNCRANLKLLPNVESSIEFIEGNSSDVLKDLIGRDERFDLVFIDGAHDYAQAGADWALARRLADRWVLHDTTQFSGLQRLVNEIRAEPEFEVFQFPGLPGHIRTKKLLGLLKQMTEIDRRTGMTLVQRRSALDDLPRHACYDDQGRFIA
jgi:hypothetical protein